MLLVKNLLTQWETEEEKQTRDQSIKNLLTDEGDREENRKIIKCRYCQWKNLPTWTKDRKEKTEIGGERGVVVWSMRDLDDKELGQNSDSSLSPLPCRLFLFASFLSPFSYCLFLVASSLSPHLAQFLACPVSCCRFHFARSWVVGLAIGGAKSRGANVAVGFSEWSL